MNRKITGIVWNWAPALAEFLADRYEDAHLGYNGVVNIVERPAYETGDRTSFEIHYEAGNVTRIFNPNKVYYAPANEEIRSSSTTSDPMPDLPF